MNVMQQAFLAAGLPPTPPPVMTGERKSYHFVPYALHHFAELRRKQETLTPEDEEESRD